MHINPVKKDASQPLLWALVAQFVGQIISNGIGLPLNLIINRVAINEKNSLGLGWTLGGFHLREEYAQSLVGVVFVVGSFWMVLRLMRYSFGPSLTLFRGVFALLVLLTSFNLVQGVTGLWLVNPLAEGTGF